ncbi:MAG: 16S rRNA (guanine(527)-N(7))-methyltransferase RsmG [Breznakia sp.]
MRGQKKFYKALMDMEVFLDDKQKQAFEIYKDLLVEWNQKMNLTAIKEEEDIYIRHFLDSIQLSVDYPIQKDICDVGSGAGFPSIPLKILYEDLEVWIVEPLQKRCVFLQEVVQTLQLEKVNIVHARAEDFVKEKREAFSLVSARAVANLTMLSELCIPLVKKNGYFVAMKGPKGYAEYEAAKGAIELLGCEKETFIEHKIADFKRLTMIFKKVKLTPKKYPRVFGKIKKQPLIKG